MDSTVQRWQIGIEYRVGSHLDRRTAVGAAPRRLVSTNAGGEDRRGSAKAASLHLAQCLALAGAPAEIRVNAVNPDAVTRGSRIWDGDWRQERAGAHGIDAGEELEEHYRKRSMLTQCYAKALLVDREALHEAQERNDAMMAFQRLRRAYNVDVAPILAKARVEAGGALDPLQAYRSSGWRERKAQERRPVGLGAGIV